jgi:hypothetical protein
MRPPAAKRITLSNILNWGSRYYTCYQKLLSLHKSLGGQKHFGGYRNYQQFNQSERFEIWQKVKSGELKIILGEVIDIFPLPIPAYHRG